MQSSDIYQRQANGAIEAEARGEDIVTLVTDDYPNDLVGYIDLSYFYLTLSGFDTVQSGRVFTNLLTLYLTTRR